METTFQKVSDPSDRSDVLRICASEPSLIILSLWCKLSDSSDHMEIARSLPSLASFVSFVSFLLLKEFPATGTTAAIIWKPFDRYCRSRRSCRWKIYQRRERQERSYGNQALLTIKENLCEPKICIVFLKSTCYSLSGSQVNSSQNLSEWFQHKSGNILRPRKSQCLSSVGHLRRTYDS